jgi:eukaryotic-like serine/threonine-protein kinase
LIDQGALFMAFNSWTGDKAQSIAQILVDQGDLDASRRDLLEQLVAEHTKLHGQEPEKSLAAIETDWSTRKRLAQISDAELAASVAMIGSKDRPIDPHHNTRSMFATPLLPRQELAASDVDGELTSTFTAGTPSSGGSRFRVLRPYARGGLGAVYVAVDTELHREVAVKQLLDQLADDPTSRQRFMVEAEIAGGLAHPGIVPVYGRGHYANGRPFYAMRFIRGDSLKDAIGAFHADAPLRRDPGRRSLELRKLLRRFVDVCNAIEYAHSRGVLHRDLKPSNIIVGMHGETLVVDWGLAKAVGRSETSIGSEERTLVPSSASGTPETLPGAAMGTPAFMSPEQAIGDVDRLGPRSDVYSLGATLYALLTGRPPVAGTDVGAMLKAVRVGEFPRPRKLDASIDRPLEAICLKAMARSPEDRYPSPRALADDIERWMADEPVTARRESFARRARLWARRHRTLTVSSAAVVIFGLAGLAGFAVVLASKNLELDAINSELIQKNRKLDAKDVENRLVLEFFETKILGAARPKDQDGGLGADATVRAAMDGAESAVARSFVNQPVLEASIRNTLGQSYLYLGEPSAAIRQLEQAVALRRKVLGPDHPDTLDSTTNFALAYQDAGRLAEALAIQEETLERCKAKLGLDDRVTLIAMNNLATAYSVSGQVERALPLLEDALKRRQTNLGPDNHDTLISMNNLATTYQDAGQNDRATPLLEETLERERGTLGPDHPDTLIAMNNLARAYQIAGQLDRALPLYEVALKRQQALLGPDHADTLNSMGNLATLYRSAGRLADALPLHQETLDRLKASLGPDHPATLRAMSNLAGAYRAGGRQAESLALYEETEKRRRSKLGLNHPETLLSMNNLARAYLVDQPARAESLAREALAIRVARAPDEWLTFDTRSLLGASLLGQKKFAEAEPMLLEGYAGMKARETTIPAHAKKAVADACARIVELYDASGKKDKADEWRRRLASPADTSKPIKGDSTGNKAILGVTSRHVVRDFRGDAALDKVRSPSFCLSQGHPPGLIRAASLSQEFR